MVTSSTPGFGPHRRTLLFSVFEGCFAMFPATFTTGVFLSGFALLLGANAMALGLVAAIPAVAQGAQLLAAALLARGDRRKSLVIVAASLSRYLWLPIVALPFLPLSPTARLACFFLMLALATASGQMANTAWSSWMGDLVPCEVRGRYFGFRNAVNALVAMGVTWGGTQIMSRFKGHGLEAQGFAWLIVIAGVASVISQGLLHWQAPPPPAPRGLGAWQSFRDAWHSPAFKRLALPLCAWTLVVNLTGPFMIPYAMQQLGLDYATMGLYTMLTGAVGVASQLAWGRLIDRWGAWRALAVAMAPITLHPITWAVMSPGFTAPLWLDAVSTGFFWTGVSLATFALWLERAPHGAQAPYTSLFNSGAGLATGLGALAGGAVLARLGSQPYYLLGHSLVAMQVLLWPTVLLRALCYALYLWARPAPSRFAERLVPQAELGARALVDH